MTTRLRVLLALALVSVGIPCRRIAAQERLQLGLRLDDRSAMQWNGTLLMTQSDARSYTRLPVAAIVDVWPGPLRGSFAVVDTHSVGMLLGNTVIPSSLDLTGGAIARSSRPDVVFVYRAKGTGGSITELRPPNRARELLSLTEPVADFDATADGSLVTLRRDGAVVLYADGRGPTSTLPADVVMGLLEGHTPERLFIDAAGTELALVGGHTLAHVDLATGRATRTDFDASSQALVRSAASRRIHLEPRWTIGRPSAPPGGH